MKKITPDLIKKTLLDSVDQLLLDRAKYLVEPKKSFSRTQKITFRDSMIFPMIIASESTAVEMLDFFLYQSCHPRLPCHIAETR